MRAGNDFFADFRKVRARSGSRLAVAFILINDNVLDTLPGICIAKTAKEEAKEYQLPQNKDETTRENKNKTRTKVKHRPRRDCRS